MPRPPANALAVLGFSAEEEELYRIVLGVSGNDIDSVAAITDRSLEELTAALAGFVEIGLVTFTDGRVLASPPAGAVAALITSQTDAVRRAADRLDELRDAIPALRAAFKAEPTPGGEPLNGSVQGGGDVPGMLASWISQSTGDMLWWRPDQWRLPHEPALRETVAAAVARGRRSRAIYPATILEDAPEVLFARAESGEEVRIMAEVPTRMAIVSGVGVLLPEHWGGYNDRRLILRQPGLVQAMTYLFDQAWNRAIVVPGLDHRRRKIGPDGVRRMLLEQLADGAKDEQIARALGLSLRTVRRRVAELLEELDVDTRFQAGVEAVRRGWI